MYQLTWAQIVEIEKVIYGLLTCALFIFASDLILRYFKASKEVRSQPAYSGFFFISVGVLGTGVYSIFALIHFLFKSSDTGVAVLTFIPMATLTFFAFGTENLVIFPSKESNVGKCRVGYLTSIGIGICIYSAVLVVIHIFDKDDTWEIIPFIPVYIGIAIYGIFAFWAFIILFFHRLQPRPIVRKWIYSALICGFIAFSGTTLEGLSRLIFRNELFFIGTIIEIGGWVGIRHYFLLIPSYSELTRINGIDPSFFPNQNTYSVFFSNPENAGQYERLRFRFSRQIGRGQPPRGEFSAIIILLLNNPDVFGTKVRERSFLTVAVTHITNNILKLEIDSERIRKNTVNHLQKLITMKIVIDEGNLLRLNPKWETLL